MNQGVAIDMNYILRVGGEVVARCDCVDLLASYGFLVSIAETTVSFLSRESECVAPVCCVVNIPLRQG